METQNFRYVLAEATSALGSQDNAMQWLEAESRALGGQRPLDLIESADGLQKVLEEINTIKHGNWA